MITRVDIPDSPWDLWRIGPLVAVQAHSGEFFGTLQVCYNQADQASAVITTWTIDGEVKCERMEGSNASWPMFWESFLDALPVDIQPEVAHSENTVKF